MNFIKEIFNDLDIKNILNFNSNTSIIEKPLTPEQALGFIPFDEQRHWVNYVNSNLNHSFNTVHVFIILTSRHYGKTDLLAVYNPYMLLFYDFLANNYTKSYGIFTRNFSRTKGIISSIGNLFKQSGFKNDLKINSLEIKHKLNNSKTPNILKLNSSLSTFRGLHLDLLIFDDLVSPEDEHSEVLRDKGKRILAESYNIANNIILLGQPVHEDDVYALIKKAYSSYNKKNATSKNMKIFLIESFHGSIPELDKDKNELVALGMSERDIMKNYFGVLVPNELYPFANIAIKEFEYTGATYAAIDPSFDGSDTVGVAIAVENENTGNFLCKVKAFEGNVINLVQQILAFLEKNKVDICYIESNDNNYTLNTFKNLENTNILFKGYKEKSNKYSRILTRIGYRKHKIVLCNKDSDNKKIIHYQKDTKHDDVADALASLLNIIDNNVDKIRLI